MITSKSIWFKEFDRVRSENQGYRIPDLTIVNLYILEEMIKQKFQINYGDKPFMYWAEYRNQLFNLIKLH